MQSVAVFYCGDGQSRYGFGRLSDEYTQLGLRWAQVGTDTCLCVLVGANFPALGKWMLTSHEQNTSTELPRFLFHFDLNQKIDVPLQKKAVRIDRICFAATRKAHLGFRFNFKTRSEEVTITNWLLPWRLVAMNFHGNMKPGSDGFKKPPPRHQNGFGRVVIHAGMELKFVWWQIVRCLPLSWQKASF